MKKISELPPKDEKISLDYLTMLKNSRRQMEMASAVNQFVISNIQQTYKLGPEDELDLDTGKITRNSNEPQGNQKDGTK